MRRMIHTESSATARNLYEDNIRPKADTLIIESCLDGRRHLWGLSPRSHLSKLGISGV